jgi:hypothetical protein
MQVGADHQVIVNQEGEQQDHHHLPSQSHIVSHNLQAVPVPATCPLTGKLANLVSTVASPAVQHTTVVLNSQLHSPAMVLQKQKIQVIFLVLSLFCPPLLKTLLHAVLDSCKGCSM